MEYIGNKDHQVSQNGAMKLLQFLLFAKEVMRVAVKTLIMSRTSVCSKICSLGFL